MQFLLRQAHGEFFMWLADDDEITETYVSSLAQILIEHADVVTAMGHRVLVHPDGDRESKETLVFPDSRALPRLLRYCWRAHDAFFYGLHRSAALRRAQFVEFWGPNRLSPINTAYVYLFDLVAQGRVVLTTDHTAQWIHHGYEGKHYTLARRGGALGLLNYALRRWNLYFLYFGKALKWKLLPLALAMLVVLPFAWLRDIKGPARVFVSNTLRSAMRARGPVASRAVLYVAKYDPERAPGIHRKVTATLKAAESLGYRTRNLSEHGSTLRLREVMRTIITCKERFIFIRHVPESAFLLMPVLACARIQGKAILVDVPNPNSVAVHEIWNQDAPWWHRALRIAKVYVGGPFAFWPASKIVQHADESWWFSLGNRRRTVKQGNGIDLESVRPRLRSPEWPNSELKLVAVATLTFWHGYDRLIKAIFQWNSTPNRPYEVTLTLIGDGRARNDLEALARDLGVEASIAFTGMQAPAAIAAYYAEAHLAVGSLGIHRKGLRENPSELKAREYSLAGIPFIACGSDPDFPPGLPFRIVVSSDDTTADLIEVFARFGEIRARFTDDEVRAHALANLGYVPKLRQLGLSDPA
jgi:glycosyltransferase involved in cell wall biosynthesis